MTGWSPGCYIPSFVEIGLPVPEKKILKGFYHIWAWWPSGSCDQHQIFISLYLKAFIQNLVQIGTVVSEKIQFEFLFQSHEMTLTFNTHISSYIQLDVCSYYLSGHWLQLFLKNPLFSLFPIEKPKLPNLTLP